MPFQFEKQDIAGLVVVKPGVFPDDRGYFLETYKESEFAAAGIAEKFTQDNHSLSKKGVIRGLHYQLDPHAQGKLVRVVKGAIWDVAVDIRKNSPTFGKWIGVELSESNHHMFYIPGGFAHGFIALSDEVQMLYKCTNEYDKSSDRGIRFDDPDLNIPWETYGSSFVVSDKDKMLPCLKDAEVFK